MRILYKNTLYEVDTVNIYANEISEKLRKLKTNNVKIYTTIRRTAGKVIITGYTNSEAIEKLKEIGYLDFNECEAVSEIPIKKF